MRLITVAAAVLLAPATALADGRVMLLPGDGYRVEFKTAKARITSSPRVERKGWFATDRWFQVAPGGRSLAIWSKATGLAVLSSDGAELLRRKDGVTAFRFSPNGERIAIASAKGIEILPAEGHEARLLAVVTGIDWLRWTDAGIIAARRSKLLLVDDVGKQRTLATLPPGVIAAASRGRVVFFDRGTIMDVNFSEGGAVAGQKLPDRDRVINAELSPDGAKVLFATTKRVYLMDGKAPPEKLADIRDVHSLFFSPDGSAYLWAANYGGAVVAKGKQTPLPAEPEVHSARFRQDGGAELVLTNKDGTMTWNPTTGAKVILGGIPPTHGANYSGDVAGRGAIVFGYLATWQEQKFLMEMEFLEQTRPGRLLDNDPDSTRP